MARRSGGAGSSVAALATPLAVIAALVALLEPGVPRGRFSVLALVALGIGGLALIALGLQRLGRASGGWKRATLAAAASLTRLATVRQGAARVVTPRTARRDLLS